MDQTRDQIPVIDYVIETAARIRELMDIVQINVSEAQSKQHYYYNKNSRAQKYKEGFQVQIMIPTGISKNKAKWHEPYTIAQCIGVNYLINLHGEQKLYHANLIKPYHARTKETDADTGIQSFLVIFDEEK